MYTMRAESNRKAAQVFPEEDLALAAAAAAGLPVRAVAHSVVEEEEAEEGGGGGGDETGAGDDSDSGDSVYLEFKDFARRLSIGRNSILIPLG